MEIQNHRFSNWKLREIEKDFKGLERIMTMEIIIDVGDGSGKKIRHVAYAQSESIGIHEKIRKKVTEPYLGEWNISTEFGKEMECGQVLPFFNEFKLEGERK